MLNKLTKAFQSDTIKFIGKNKEAQNAYTFTFTKPKMTYSAGQHFIFQLKHTQQDKRGSIRVFSVTSAPHEDVLAVTTRFFGNDSSSFKKSLMELKKGDTVKIIGPSFLSDTFKIKDYSRPQVFIVGGVGATPLLSVLRDELHNQRGTKIDVFYANKDEDFIFGKEINSIAKKLKHVSLTKVVSPKRFSASQLKKAVTPQSEIAISGTPGFVKYYKDLLVGEIGVSKKSIRNYKQKPTIGPGY